MATWTAEVRKVFVLGKELHGNRQAVVVESGAEYSLDATTTEYSETTARFPYEL